MQEQIKKLNSVANSDRHTDDVREYAQGLAKFLWSFDMLHRKQCEINEKMLHLVKNNKQ